MLSKILSLSLGALILCCGIILFGLLATELDSLFTPYQDYHIQQEVVHAGFKLDFNHDEGTPYLSIIDEDESNYWSCPNCTHLNGEMVSKCGGCGCSKFL